MTIINRDRYPDVDFLPDSEIKPIGTCEGVRLVLVGKEQGTNADVVAKSYSDEFSPDEELHATPLYELLNHTMGAIELFE